MPHSHRSSGLKQSNKGHKSNRASKRSINRLAGGKVQGRTGIKSKKHGGPISKAKADRANMAQQRRVASREKILKQKRVQGRLNLNSVDSSVVPRVVGIISLSQSEKQLEDYVRNFLIDGSEKSVGQSDTSSSVTAMYSKYKKEGFLTFLTNTTAFSTLYARDFEEEDQSVQAALDLCRVCDTIMLLVDGRDVKKGDASIFSGMDIGGDAAVSEKSGATNDQPYDHLISTRGERVLSGIKAQGLPTPMTVLVNFEGENDLEEMSISSSLSMKSVRRSAIKQKLSLRRYLTRFSETEFGEGAEKVLEIDIPEIDADSEMNLDNSKVLALGKSKKILPAALADKSRDDCPTRAACIRALCTMRASPPKWVSEMPRSYILSDNNGVENKGYEYDEEKQELKIKGYIRGQVPWNVNSSVHLPNIGTFSVKCVEKNDRSAMRFSKRKGQTDTMMDSGNEILAKSDFNIREPLDMFANPDALDGEQNLIGFEEGNDDFYEEDANNKDNDGFKKGTVRPAGWSDYQSAWLDAIDGEDDDEMKFDHGELAFDLNKKKDDATVTSMDMDEEDANNVSAKERQILFEQRRKDTEEQQMFPDEVEVGEDVNASDRYARYRSLKSFRKSYWDPKENLPGTYGTIFHFSSFKATQGDVLADMKDVVEASNTEFYSKKDNIEADDDDEMMAQDGTDSEDDDILAGCVPSGTFVTLVVEGVSKFHFERISTSALLTAVCLLPHENKISVLHMNLSQTTQCDNYGSNELPVKSKDVLNFRCGWRTWQGRPVFSQNNLNCDKHKFERYMPANGAFFSTTVFGPVTYTPCPVLVFREQDKKSSLVALGSIFNADADRIVVKRIILTGYPTRVHKRHATVKYMFWNPDDVKVRLVFLSLVQDVWRPFLHLTLILFPLQLVVQTSWIIN
jgi:pre-rRNA-processing protein TSR1